MSGLEIYSLTPDMVRILAVPIFIYAAYLDYQIRRVYDELWLPLLGLSILTLSWDMWLTTVSTDPHSSDFLIAVVGSIVCVPPVAFSLWSNDIIGGADLKGIIILALCFPVVPFHATTVTYPVVEGVTPVFAVTVLLNAFLLSWAYHSVVIAPNFVHGDYDPRMFRAVRYRTETIDEQHGVILTQDDTQTRGVDIDVIRMYLRWRDRTVTELQAAPSVYRRSGPVRHHHISNGVVTNTVQTPYGRSDGDKRSDPKPRDSQRQQLESVDTTTGLHDPWSADTFAEILTHHSHLTTAQPAEIRAALNTLTTQSHIWVSPSIPFFIPLTIGLIIGIGYGSLFVGSTTAIAELIIQLTSVV